VAVEVMRFMNAQGYRAFVLLDQFTQVPLAFLALGRDAELFLGREVVEQRGNQRAQLDAVLFGVLSTSNRKPPLCSVSPAIDMRPSAYAVIFPARVAVKCKWRRI